MCRPKPADFMAKVPSGLLPVIEIDGRRLTESAAIMAWIEAEFPEQLPLARPPGHPELPRYQALMRLERRLFGDWLQWLTNGWCALSHWAPTIEPPECSCCGVV